MDLVKLKNYWNKITLKCFSWKTADLELRRFRNDGAKCVWAHTCPSTNMSGHKRVWSQTCLGKNVYGHKRVWAQMCLGTVVWAQSCMGTNVVEPFYLWTFHHEVYVRISFYSSWDQPRLLCAVVHANHHVAFIGLKIKSRVGLKLPHHHLITILIVMN